MAKTGRKNMGLFLKKTKKQFQADGKKKRRPEMSTG